MVQTVRLRRARSALRQMSYTLFAARERAAFLIGEERKSDPPCLATMRELERIVEVLSKLDNSFMLPVADNGGESTLFPR